jgi:hypothetical protein
MPPCKCLKPLAHSELCRPDHTFGACSRPPLVIVAPMTYQLMRFGAALSLGGALTAVACGGTDSAAGGTTPDASASGTGGGSTGNGGSATGNGGAATGNGGNATGNGGAATGNGGNATGSGGAGNADAGGAGTLTCPAQPPNDGDPCTATGTCPYGGETCACTRLRAGAQRTFRCRAAPDGGFNPGGDAGGTTACAHTTECTTGVCCGFRQGATTGACVSAANCTRFGGTEIP